MASFPKRWLLWLCAVPAWGQEAPAPASLVLPEPTGDGFEILKRELSKLVPADRFTPTGATAPVRIHFKAEQAGQGDALERWVDVWEGESAGDAAIQAFDAQTTAEDFYRLALRIGEQQAGPPDASGLPRFNLAVDDWADGAWLYQRMPAWPDAGLPYDQGLLLENTWVEEVIPPALRAVSRVQEASNPYLQASIEKTDNPYLQQSMQTGSSAAFAASYAAAATVDLGRGAATAAIDSVPESVTGSLPSWPGTDFSTATSTDVEDGDTEEAEPSQDSFSSFSSWERR